MAPVVKALKKLDGVKVSVCVTAQHRQMLDQVLEFFDIKPDVDLNLMKANQTLTDVTSSILVKLQDVYQRLKPDWVFVHGDTTTTFASSLAAYYQKIPVAHVEAGLRTGNIYSPWPEEMNRHLTSVITALHFAPTEGSRANLIKENVAEETIHVTGNTVIDALMDSVERIHNNAKLRNSLLEKFSFLDLKKRILLVTGHRRENFGSGFESICQALRTLSERDDVEIVYPVHLNPNVQEPVRRILEGRKNIHLIEPLDYPSFVFLMDLSYLIITDSGGVQEEAPSLGKPVLVMREITERPEAVQAGTVVLVGTDTNKIINETIRLLDDPVCYNSRSKIANPYGDGQAAERIAKGMVARFGG